MARYEHLPIFKRMMGLTIYIENHVRKFSLYHKYSLMNSSTNSCKHPANHRRTYCPSQQASALCS